MASHPASGQQPSTAQMSGWTKVSAGPRSSGFGLSDAIVKIVQYADAPGSLSRRGTGILISPTAILTVAHNVPSCGSNQDVRFATARRLERDLSADGPYRDIASVQCYDDEPFTDADGQTDLAILHLGQPVGGFRPVFRLALLDLKAEKPSIRIAGFKKRANIVTQQSGPMMTHDDRRIYYPHSTQDGHSGSPAIQIGAAAPGVAVVGLHKRGINSTGPDHERHWSSAVRFTQPILDWIHAMAPPPAIPPSVIETLNKPAPPPAKSG